MLKMFLGKPDWVGLWFKIWLWLSCGLTALGILALIIYQPQMPPTDPDPWNDAMLWSGILAILAIGIFSAICSIIVTLTWRFARWWKGNSPRHYRNHEVS